MRVAIRAPQSKNHSGSPTSYISERPRNELIEGNEARLLFSAEHDFLTIEEADRIVTQSDSPLERGDTFHFVLSLRPEDYERMGNSEQEQQAGLRSVVRAGMEEMQRSLHADKLRWSAGIHRNTENPHAHVVVWKHYRDTEQYKDKTLNEMPYRLLPKHETDEAGRVSLLNSPFIQAIENELDRQAAMTRERPFFEVSEQTDISSPPEPEWMAEQFERPIEETEPDQIEDTLDLSHVAGNHYFHSVKLANLEQSLETFDRKSYYWKVGVRDEHGFPVRTSLHEIHRESITEAKNFFASQNITSPHPDTFLLRVQAFESARPEKQQIEIHLQQRKAEMFEQVSELRAKVGQEAFSQGNIPRITDAKQSQYLISDAIRKGDTEQLKQTLHATAPDTLSSQWLNGQRLLADALSQQASFQHQQHQIHSPYERTKDGSYASQLRKAQFWERNAQIIDTNGNLIIDNLIPSQRELRLNEADKFKQATEQITSRLDARNQNLIDRMEKIREIAEGIQASDGPLTLSWRDYRQITEIATKTQNKELWERANSAELTNAPTDIEKAKAEHVTQLTSQLNVEIDGLTTDRQYLKEQGRTQTVVVNINGKDQALSLRSSEYNDSQRLFNFRPSETTIAVVDTLNDQWFRLNRDIESRRDFLQVLGGELPSPTHSTPSKEVVREELRDIPNAPIEVERPSQAEQRQHDDFPDR